MFTNRKRVSHFRVRKAEDSNSSVKELPLQPLAVPIERHCCGLFMYNSALKSSKYTNLSLQQLIDYYETKEYVVTISWCVFRDLNRSARGV